MLYATGTSGTIGKHLTRGIQPLDIDLSVNFKLDKKYNYSGGAMLHFAGVVGESEVLKDLQYSRKVNLVGTSQLGKLALEAGINKFVYISTSHVYKQKYTKIFETDPTEPTNHYSEQKLSAEEQLKEIFKDDQSKLLILRVFSILDWEGKDFTLSGAIRGLMSGKIESIKNGEDVRDFLQPAQVAKVAEILARSKDAQGIMNLSSGVGLTIHKVVELMLKQANMLDLIYKVEKTRSMSPHIVGDNAKLLSQLEENNLFWKTPGYFKWE